MKQLAALAWKEWCEVRILFAIAMFVFLGLPIIGGIEFALFQHGHFSIDTSVWVFFLGSLFAIVVGVGIVTRDVNGKLEEFWRSRPVSVSHWLSVKYFVGLITVLFSLIVPLLVEVKYGSTLGVVRTGVLLAWHPFLWIAIYSTAFAAACIVRRGAHAAMFSVSIALLLYFLPTIFPPLRFLSIIEVTAESEQRRQEYLFPWLIWREARQLGFAYGMLAIAIGGLIISIIALRRDWRIQAGRKMLYWSLGSALLLLFATAAFQVGANLQVISSGTVPTSPDLKDSLESRRYGRFDSSEFVAADEKSGIVISETVINQSLKNYVRKFSLAGGRVEFEEPFEIPVFGSLRGEIWSGANPDLLYHFDEEILPSSAPPTRRVNPVLTTNHLQPDGRTSSSRRVFPDSYPMRPTAANRNYSGMGALIWNGRLYALGSYACIFDLSDPYVPRLLQTIEMPFGTGAEVATEDKLEIQLPPIPELPLRQQLQLLNPAGGWYSRSMFQGDILVRYVNGGVYEFKLAGFSDGKATFDHPGRYEPSPLERWTRGSELRTAASPGLLFQLYIGQIGGSHLMVYDLAGARPTLAGHFALGDRYDYGLCPLPGGKLLAIGTTNYFLLAAPSIKK